MSIISSFFGRFRGGGNPFEEALSRGIDRLNVKFMLPEDSRLYATEWTRSALNEKSEWLWQHFPLVKELTEGIARHTVGKGMSIQIETEDHDFNTAAERDFEAWALSPDRCDISARRNFYECQAHAVEQWLIRGEFFAAHVQNPRWPSPLSGTPAPSFWSIDSNDVRTPPMLSDPAQLDRVIDGIELGRYGEPIRYFARVAGETNFQPIPASDLCHWFKPHAVNQPRGLTPFAQAVNSLVDVHQLRNLTVRTAKANQLVALMVKNMGKGAKRGGLGAIEGNPTEGNADLEAAGRNAGAAIAYVGADGDVKMVQASAPSPLVSPFVRDMLLRDACLAPGVPMEFFWDPSSLGGANTRFVLGRADLFFQILADALLYRFCTPFAIRFLDWRITNGLLAVPKDPAWKDRISWQLPARLTVDNGREGALDIAKLKCCLLTLRAYYNARGMNWRTELQQRIREMQQLKRMCDDAGMPELFQYFIALDPGTQLIQHQAAANQVDANDDNGGKKQAA
ncbi:MAG: phage portal protein [Chthoniobacteraceae bacterium]